MTIGRPNPPQGLTEDDPHIFMPAPEIIKWVKEAFLDPGSPLYNPEHEHLAGAELAALWTNVPNIKKGRRIVGTAEMPSQSGGTPWQTGRKRQQLEEWFGLEPDFLITIDAVATAEWSDDRWCAVIEHELSHCGQEVDRDGLPRFDADGNPVFGMRPHDVEEFVSVVARYGVTASVAQAIVSAALTGRILSEETVAIACGTCRGN